jgi:hypothetical protein
MDDKALEQGLWKMRLFWLVILTCEIAFVVGSVGFGLPHVRDKMMPHLPEICVVFSAGILVWNFVGPRRELLRQMRERLVLETTEDGKSVLDPRRTTLQAMGRFSMWIGRTWSIPVAVSMLGFMLFGYGEPLSFVLPFFVVPIAITLTQFPRLGVYAKLIERAKGVRCELPSQ